MRNIQFSSPVDALWQENEFAKNALLASHVVSSESSNVYTGTPYSGQGKSEPLVSTQISRINWHHSWLFELTRRHS